MVQKPNPIQETRLNKMPFKVIEKNEERKQESKSQENNKWKWLHKLKYICTVDHVIELSKITKHNCMSCHRKYVWYICTLPGVKVAGKRIAQVNGID